MAVLEHYYAHIRVLDPEVSEDEQVPPPAHSPSGVGTEDFLSGLSPDLRKRAYRALALALHPDQGGDDEAFKRLQDWRGSRGDQG